METRVLNWVGAVVGLVVATPVARALYKDFAAYRAMKQQGSAIVLNIHNGLPPDALRDIYDSTRR